MLHLERKLLTQDVLYVTIMLKCTYLKLFVQHFVSYVPARVCVRYNNYYTVIQGINVYLINANFESHFSGIFLKTTLIYL